MKKNITDIYTYIINENDEILYVNNQNWDEFYKDNSNVDLCTSKDISKKSLWNFIEDFETRHLYENILENVRKYNRQVTLPFRCDSPTQRRFLNLTIKPLDNNHVKFISKIEKVENRAYVKLMDNNREFSEEFLTVCSMCKKVKLEETLWEEVETAVSILKIFEKDKLPMLTHGLCPYCKRLYLEEAEKFIASISSA